MDIWVIFHFLLLDASVNTLVRVCVCEHVQKFLLEVEMLTYRVCVHSRLLDVARIFVSRYQFTLLSVAYEQPLFPIPPRPPSWYYQTLKICISLYLDSLLCSIYLFLFMCQYHGIISL